MTGKHPHGNKPQQPARQSDRTHPGGITMETTEFAKARDKRRRRNKLAQASRRKNRK